jgi:hypothetical protein
VRHGIQAVAVLLFFLATLIYLAGTASALAIYTYEGHDFSVVANDTSVPGVPGGTYTTSMSVTGSITLSEPLPPDMLSLDLSGSVVAYSFTDGRQTLTHLNSVVPGGMFVATDAAGNIWEWAFHLWQFGFQPIPQAGDIRREIVTSWLAFSGEDVGQIEECVVPTGSVCTETSVDLARNVNLPGTWSVVPTPSSRWLLATGLVALAWRVRSRLVA